MPLDSNTKLEPIMPSADGVFEPLPEDVYQFELIDIDTKEGKKYMSEEMETQLVFTFAIVEDGNWYGRRQWVYASQKLSSYKDGSKLYNLLKVVMGREITKEEEANPASLINPDFLNTLMGEQVRMTVVQYDKKDGSKGNKVKGFLPVKEKLPAFDKEKSKEMAEKRKADSATLEAPAEQELPPVGA